MPDTLQLSLLACLDQTKTPSKRRIAANHANAHDTRV